MRLNCSNDNAVHGSGASAGCALLYAQSVSMITRYMALGASAGCALLCAPIVPMMPGKAQGCGSKCDFNNGSVMSGALSPKTFEQQSFMDLLEEKRKFKELEFFCSTEVSERKKGRETETHAWTRTHACILSHTHIHVYMFHAHVHAHVH